MLPLSGIRQDSSASDLPVGNSDMAALHLDARTSSMDAASPSFSLTRDESAHEPSFSDSSIGESPARSLFDLY